MIKLMKYAGPKQSLKNAIKLTELVYKDLLYTKSIWSQEAEHKEVFECELPVKLESLHKRLFVIAKMATDDLADHDIDIGIISCLIVYTKIRFRNPVNFMKKLTKTGLSIHPDALSKFLELVFEVNCRIVKGAAEDEYICYI